MEDSFYMRKALEQAQYALEKNEVPVGAVIVFDQKIIARTHNLTEMLNDVTAHAEMQGITSAAAALGGKYLRGCTLYVTLEPCMMCAGALYWSQISRVVFAAQDNERGYRAMGGRLHPKTEVLFGVLQEEATQLLTSFFQSKRSKNF